MHTNKNYRFETKEEAQDYANRYLGPDGRPDRDTYVTGPFLRDDSVTFKSMPWVECEAPYWTVGIEIYS
tara:strand:+ start:2306 stop:2512 length:207 start_codon:yes stop_codon:yes gene_type:complete